MNTLKQTPKLDQNIIRFCGETIRFTIQAENELEGQVFLRTNLCRGNIRIQEIIKLTEFGLIPLNKDWHDMPMQKISGKIYEINIPLIEVGIFEAKAYWKDDNQKIHWPLGKNTIIKVEPVSSYTNNTIYTAFVRLFGSSKSKDIINSSHEKNIKKLDEEGYSVLPPSGTFRDLIEQLDFIIGKLRCRIIQLLPVHPTPTTYARMGRYGSPFAALDLLDIDPALSSFDQCTTPIDQFQELIDAIHSRNGLIFMDMPINHTGWGSHLQNHRSKWFLRNNDNKFKSPGAWGVLWEDLSKLDYSFKELWIYMAEVFLFWCKKGVDGFRCDAGYKIPSEAWKYIIAKVRNEYPNTIFMLEGLGGDPLITKELLTDSGMNWAYSEIFQNYDRSSIENYLPESHKISNSKGNLIHFSETHDNNRIASYSKIFAKLRMALCALTSTNGASGFTNGVEWFATKKIDVHNSYSLNWGSPENQIEWISKIHALMETHPSFLAGSSLEIITMEQGEYLAILRSSKDRKHHLLLLMNLDETNSYRINHDFKSYNINLLGECNKNNVLNPGEVKCFTNNQIWIKLISDRLKKPFNFSKTLQNQLIKFKILQINSYFKNYRNLPIESFTKDIFGFLSKSLNKKCFTKWTFPHDQNRIVIVPPDNLLVIKTNNQFIAEIKDGDLTKAHERCIKLDDGSFIVIFLPFQKENIHSLLKLHLTILDNESVKRTLSELLYATNSEKLMINNVFRINKYSKNNASSICTNSLGSLSQIRSKWGSLESKYDGILQANLNHNFPVDRHIMLTRCRGWILFNGFSTEINSSCQTHFGSLPTGESIWHFNIPIGQGFIIALTIFLKLDNNKNAITLTFERHKSSSNLEELPDTEEIKLIIRPDIEDRTNHEITTVNDDLRLHWKESTIINKNGFRFTPSNDRFLDVNLSNSTFKNESEWYEKITHSIDLERCTDGFSDLYSPGYFKTSLKGGKKVILNANINCKFIPKSLPIPDSKPLPIKDHLYQSIQSFIVNREKLQTVIAGYPWFLDWGRDSLICLRGIIEANMINEASNIILKFFSFEEKGTLPNMISGNNKSNRETSDAPLWLFVACNDFIKKNNDESFLSIKCGDRTLLEILISIAQNYISGTKNGIIMDDSSGLIFSPSHFTWMDTNYPAGTPREGYPIEIQSLWYFALNFLYKQTHDKAWQLIAQNVKKSILDNYIIKTNNDIYLADNLSAGSNINPNKANIDDSLRCNQLLAITLGAITDKSLIKNIIASCEKLLIPGAIRSLADQTVQYSSPIYLNDELLNNPNKPYYGKYIGDENSQRKPAYHNGTAWTWIFPSYVEALVLCYGSNIKSEAYAILNSSSIIVENGCIGYIPEILDGDAPHNQRGCGAQAWGCTELYRIFELVSKI